MPTIPEKLRFMEKVIEETRLDVMRFNYYNNTAGQRVRKRMQLIRAIALDIRFENNRIRRKRNDGRLKHPRKKPERKFNLYGDK